MGAVSCHIEYCNSSTSSKMKYDQPIQDHERKNFMFTVPHGNFFISLFIHIITLDARVLCYIGMYWTCQARNSDINGAHETKWKCHLKNVFFMSCSHKWLTNYFSTTTTSVWFRVVMHVDIIKEMMHFDDIGAIFAVMARPAVLS